MSSITCKKCKVLNDVSFDFCQLCGANLKGGKDFEPSNIFMMAFNNQFHDAFIAWDKDSLYAIPIEAAGSSPIFGLAGLAVKGAIKASQENKYKKEVFPLPLDEQVKIQHGKCVKFSEIEQIQQVKGVLGGAGRIEVISKEGKPLLVVTSTKQHQEHFIQKSQSYGLTVMRQY
jgi:hypothetical protein